MKSSLVFTTLLLILLTLVGCTQQDMARNYGGKAQIVVPATKKLVNITWKEANMWLLLRNRKPGETPETYTFTESSSFGINEGVITVVEQ